MLKKKKIIVLGILFLLLIGMFFISDWFWNALSPILYKDLLYKYAGEFKIDPLLIAAIIKCESTFNPMATSKKGAKGLMQMMPETAEELALELNIDYINEDELYKPEVNIQFGFYYITKLQKQYNGNLIFTLAAYNAGTKKADEWISRYKGEGEDDTIRIITFPETREFIRRVLRTYGELKFIRKLKRTLQLKD
ncbi:MAG: lytic transglycosylase domain-containing protein [Candidatus Firestonebacteria bacterium]